MDVVIVVAGGDAPHPEALRELPRPPRAHVVAADSGLEHAVALGLDVDLVVGDMDSVDPARLDAAEAGGTVVERHPRAKDETDLELALDHALDVLARDAGDQTGRIVVIAGDGGRLDHMLSMAMLLAAPAYARVAVEGRLGRAMVRVVRDEVTLHGEPGELVTLLPVHGPARGVSTEGLAYPLAGEDLGPGTSRGVSNELLGTTAKVRLREGVLLATQPAFLP